MTVIKELYESADELNNQLEDINNQIVVELSRLAKSVEVEYDEFNNVLLISDDGRCIIADKVDFNCYDIWACVDESKSKLLHSKKNISVNRIKIMLASGEL